MKIRIALPFALSLALLASCGGSSISSDVTLAEKPVETSEAPESNTEFCKNAALSKATIDNLFTSEDSDLSDKDGWNAILSVSIKMLENAPDEIEDAARDLQKGLAGFALVLEKYNYDLVAVPESAYAVLDADGKMDAASEAIDKYMAESCGIPQDS